MKKTLLIALYCLITVSNNAVASIESFAHFGQVIVPSNLYGTYTNMRNLDSTWVPSANKDIVDFNSFFQLKNNSLSSLYDENDAIMGLAGIKTNKLDILVGNRLVFLWSISSGSSTDNKDFSFVSINDGITSEILSLEINSTPTIITNFYPGIGYVSSSLNLFEWTAKYSGSVVFGIGSVNVYGNGVYPVSGTELHMEDMQILPPVVSAVPEPSPLILMMLGLAFIGYLLRRR